MPEAADQPHVRAVIDRFLGLLVGRDDPRLRATWRVLLAGPLLLFTGVVARTIPRAVGVTGLVPTGLTQLGAFAVLFVGWARYLDCRPLASYGLSASLSWLGVLVGSFGAVVGAHVAWYAIGSSLGWTTVEVAATGPTTSIALGLGAGLVAIAVNVFVQDTVYFGLVLTSAAEGLRSRGLEPARAVASGWVVAVVFVVAIHGGSAQRALGLTVAGALFGLLYVHTGSLALPVGFHASVNFCGGWLFVSSSVDSGRALAFTVTETLPVLGALSGPRVPQMVLAYLAIVAWLQWRDGEVGIDDEIARWTASSDASDR